MLKKNCTFLSWWLPESKRSKSGDERVLRNSSLKFFSYIKKIVRKGQNIPSWLEKQVGRGTRHFLHLRCLVFRWSEAKYIYFISSQSLFITMFMFPWKAKKMYLKTFNNLRLKNSIVPLISSQNNTRKRMILERWWANIIPGLNFNI